MCSLYFEEIHKILKELCAIPAPSYHEEKRAEYCKKYLENLGYDNVYIDEAKNVVCEINCEGADDITVFAAHTDTVFPDVEPMPYYEKDGRAYSPGVGDDTASLSVMLAAAKYLKDEKTTGKRGVILVCNSCEEGLGNLKGTREIMKNYEGRIGRFISFDNLLNAIAITCVGSCRYAVEVKTEGGHSFSKFGNENAILHLSNIIKKIYEIDVPKIDGSQTTYNVGTIEGGTSVNTIAQDARMLCEYRSDNVECLNIMQEKFEKIFEEEKSEKVEVFVTKVGDRPCAKGVDERLFGELVENCKGIIEEIIKEPVTLHSSSTDCNIPMSLGIPAVAVGVFVGGKWHSREEWLELDSLKQGFLVAVNLIKAYL